MMAREMSVAPKERINIVYKSISGDAKEEVELPLKLLVTGDFTGREDDTPVDDRNVVSVDKTNLNDVMKACDVNATFTVKDTLTDSADEIPVNLKFEKFRDFEPENVVRQIPELRKLLELREALTTLKGPMGNVPAFRKLLQSIISDKASRETLMNELKLLDNNSRIEIE